MDILDKIKKLLALAKDNGATEGESTAAMNAAAALIEKYQIDSAELSSYETKTTFTRIQTITNDNSQWEKSLASSVCKLFGTVGVYSTRDTIKIGNKNFGSLFFYGESKDCLLAKQLFDEFQSVISHNAYLRYKSLLRGEGLQYALGFAAGLYKIAVESTARKQTIQLATTSLAQRNSIVLRNADTWLYDTFKIRLVTRPRKDNAKLNSNAFSSGFSDGINSDFAKNRQKKLC